MNKHAPLRKILKLKEVTMVFRATLKKHTQKIRSEILFGQMQENPRVTQIGYILGI